MAESSSDRKEISDTHIHQIPAPPPGKQRNPSLLDHQHARSAKGRNLKEDAINQCAARTKLIPSLVKYSLQDLGSPLPLQVLRCLGVVCVTARKLHFILGP